MKTASAEMLKAMQDSRAFTYSFAFVFADESTLTITEDDLVDTGGISFSSGSSSLPIGCAMCQCLTLTLINYDDRYKDYDFYGCVIEASASMDFPGRTETIDLGAFTVTEPEEYGSAVTVTGYDDMYKADRPYVSSTDFPKSAGELYAEACTQSNLIPLDTTFSNYTFQVEGVPENTSCRQVIGLCAAFAGGNAVVKNGAVRIIEIKNQIVPYPVTDGGYFDTDTPYSSGADIYGGIFNPWDTGDALDGGTLQDLRSLQLFADVLNLSISTDDIVITGVQVTSGSDSYLSGTDGYVIKLDNALAAGHVTQAATLIAARLVGVKFRAFTIEIPAYPLAELGDAVLIYNNGLYTSFVTDIEFNFHGKTTLKCSADNPIRNTSKTYTAQTQAEQRLRSLLGEEKTARETAENALASAIAAKSGLYTTEQVQPDQSVIYYMHDAPQLSNSHTVWKMTADAFAVTTNYQGDQTVWDAGLTVDGVLIAKILNTNGVNADWIRSGAIQIKDAGNNETFYADTATGIVRINATQFSLTGAQITSSWTGEGVPTNSNYPAVNWGNDTTRAQHLGDMYYDENSGTGIYKYSELYEGLLLTFTGTYSYTGSGNAVIFAFKFGTAWYQIINPFEDGTVDTSIFLPTHYTYGSANKPEFLLYVVTAADGLSCNLTYRISVARDVFPDAEYYGTSQPFSAPNLSSRDINTDYTLSPAPTSGTTGRQIYVNTSPIDTTKSYGWKNIGLSGEDEYARALATRAENAVTSLDYSLNQQEIFNRLTRNGAVQGIFLENGQLFISFEFARGGALSLGTFDPNSQYHGSGYIEIYDDAGHVIGRIDEDGLYLESPPSNHNAGDSVKIADGMVYFDGQYSSGASGLVGAIDLSGESDWQTNDDVFGIRTDMYLYPQLVLCNKTVNKGILISNTDTEVIGALWVKGSVSVDGSVTVEGAKSRAVKGTEYGDRLLYSYETPTPYFGDIGTGRTDETGTAVISIDDIFDETIDTAIEYSVFLQKEGRGDLWVAEKDHSFFVVEGTPNLKFSWEVKAVQKGFEMYRLDDMALKEDAYDTVDLKEIMNDELAAYDKGMEGL